jgi:ribonuclease-3
MNKISKSVMKKLTGVDVRDIGIYQQAFCHKSAIKDLGLELSNERIEFIGDAVLNLIVGSFLFNTFPYENEGFLTRLRTKLVSGVNLCKWANDIHLGDFVVMNEKAMKNEWNTNPRIMEDTFESLVGAIYIDNNMDLDAPRIFIDGFLNNLDFEDVTRDTNYKDILMRYAQSNKLPTPEYKCQEFNDSGDKRFCVQVIVNGKLLSEGFERNKKMAEQKGSYNVLKCLQIIHV